MMNNNNPYSQYPPEAFPVPTYGVQPPQEQRSVIPQDGYGSQQVIPPPPTAHAPGPAVTAEPGITNESAWRRNGVDPYDAPPSSPPPPYAGTAQGPTSYSPLGIVTPGQGPTRFQEHDTGGGNGNNGYGYGDRPPPPNFPMHTFDSSSGPGYGGYNPNYPPSPNSAYDNFHKVGMAEMDGQRPGMSRSRKILYGVSCIVLLALGIGVAVGVTQGGASSLFGIGDDDSSPASTSTSTSTLISASASATPSWYGPP